MPTVGGEVYFEAPLRAELPDQRDVRSGSARTSDLIRSAAAGVGNLVSCSARSTGRDGIGGASVLASAELDDADEAKRPSVQIGDPFAEKKLIECSLELLDARAARRRCRTSAPPG